MKAITYDQYGGPEVLKLSEVEKPTCGDDEVLISVKAVSLNPYDWHFMRGAPYFMRLQFGLFSPKTKILGNDLAGVVEEVGKSVTDFKIGDEVIASSELRALAEYINVKANRIAIKPVNASMEEASCLMIACITALKSLREFGDIQPGQQVLINGASGGVGTFAVQIAKSMGADVTGVCSTSNVELVKSIGADHVIDYKLTDLHAMESTFDLVIDNVGNLSASLLNKLTKTGRKARVVGFGGMGQLMSIMLRSMTPNSKLKMVTFTITQQDLVDVAALMTAGKIKSVINKTYPLASGAEAMEYVEAGHVPGKVVVVI